MVEGDKKRKLATKASASKKQRTLHPVTMRQGVTNISGGQNGQAFPASTLQVVEGDRTHMFVALDKDAVWFLKGAGGPTTRKGDLKPVKVMCEIRALFNREEEGASAQLQLDDTDDPMNRMEALSGETVDNSKKQKNELADRSRGAV